MRGAVLAAALLCAPLLPLAVATAAANEKSDEWLDLWTRCRMAIEAAKPFDSTGMEPLGTEPQIREEMARRHYDFWRLWRRTGGRFEVIEAERKVAGGVRRICDVRVVADGPALTPSDIGAIARDFLVERASLLAAGAHTSEDPSPIYPMVALGVGSRTRNQNGCSVISSLFFDVRSNALLSFSGEQDRTGCSGPSRIEQDEPTGRP